MSRVFTFLFSILISLPAAASGIVNLPQTALEAPEHGGGCRKNSPAGQCCHMEKSTGKVHCH